MSSPASKLAVFILTGLNTLASTFYFNYLFFLAKEQFGFGQLQNLLLSALAGFLWVIGSWYGGRLAQQRGYFFALKIGFLGLAVATAVGGVMNSSVGQIVVFTVWTLHICLTWPTLEALACEHETVRTLPRIIGLYNLVWAGGAAVAYFLGGMVVERLGWKSLFWIPAGMHLLEVILTVWLERRWNQTTSINSAAEPPISSDCVNEDRRHALTFQRIAWVANPFAYMAINTLIPLIPKLAGNLGLSTSEAGFVCSVWMFARLGAFAMLWRWTGWHYRFGWMVASYLLLLGSFAAILLISKLWVLVVAQLLFGWAAGLIYYSSLFYSMDASDTKGVHGGIHEAALGLGIFAGPAIGAIAVNGWPAQPHAGAWAVSGLLGVGLAAIGTLWQRRDRP